MRSEEDLDYLEKKIPDLAQSATQNAFFNALSSGNSVLELIDGGIYRVFADGSKVFVKESNKSVNLPTRNLRIK